MAYSLILYSPTGDYLAQLQIRSIDVTLTERETSILTVDTLPNYSDALFQRDSRVAFYRAPQGAAIEQTPRLVGNTTWLVTTRERSFADGQHSIILTCEHPNSLLGRRVVAYDEKTNQADKYDTASDVIKEFFDENLISATDTARNIAATHLVRDSFGVSFGQTVGVHGSYRVLADCLADAAQASAAQGDYIGYEIYTPNPPGPFHFRIYRTTRGVDRGLTSGQPLVIDLATPGVRRASAIEDWSSAASFVYAGGAGKKGNRLVQTKEDTTLSSQSPFGRSERFEAFSTDDTSILDSEAYKVLNAYRPRRAFVGDAAVMPEQYAGAVYDVNYGWGDIVGARFAAPVWSRGLWSNALTIQNWVTYEFDCRVNPVHIQVVQPYDEEGNPLEPQETIEIHLQSVDSS